jgi:hypothetical protein
MSAEGGFGPDGPGVGDAPPFAVAGPSSVAVTAERSGSGSFTVSNVAGRAVRARVFVTPGAGADPSWFQVVGESELALPAAGTATVDVALSVPSEVAAGAYSFTVGVALEESPDKMVASPTVSFTVPEAVKRRFPWWIVIVAAAAVLVLGLGAAAIWWFNRPDDSEPTATDDGAPVFLEGELTVSGNEYLDLDAGLVLDASGGATGAGEDIFVFPGAGSGELVLGGQGPPRIAVVDEPTFEACQTATGYDDLDAQVVLVLPDDVLHICVRDTDQGRPAVMTIGPDGSGSHTVTFTTWERGE